MQTGLSGMSVDHPFRVQTTGLLAEQGMQWLASAVAGMTFRSLENMFQMSKTLCVTPQHSVAARAVATEIVRSTPRQAKSKGRYLRGLDVSRWNHVSLDVMTAAAEQQALHNDDFRGLLLATGELPLYEASPEDSEWGIGYTAERALQMPFSTWGANKHGQALMRVRRRMRERFGSSAAPALGGEPDAGEAASGASAAPGAF